MMAILTGVRKNVNSLMKGIALSEKYTGASLVAQWLGIRLLMQGTRVRALVQAAEQLGPCATTTEPAL